MAGGWAWLRSAALLDAAVIAMAVGIFEAQAHLWTIFLQVEELLAVERSATLPGRKKKPGEDVNVIRHEQRLRAVSARGRQRAEPGQRARSASVQTYCRMNWTASSYFIPHSIRARATRTGALPGQRGDEDKAAIWHGVRRASG